MNHFFFLNDFCVMFMCPIRKSVGQRKLHLVVNQGLGAKEPCVGYV